MTRENTQFFVIKLATGETLFSEVTAVVETHVTLRKPLLIKDIQHNGDGALVGQPWLPYVEDDTQVTIPIELIFLFQLLSEKFVKFYGAILMQQEIQKIKAETVDELDGDEQIDYYKMQEAVQRINDASEYMTMKFGIERVDVSQFQAKAEQVKPLMH